MICERCGHHTSVHHYLVDCVANLRADLAATRAEKVALDAETRACAAEERARAFQDLIRRVVAEVDPPLGAGRCITGSTIASLRAALTTSKERL